MKTLDNEIRCIAMERFGATDASVRQWDDRPSMSYGAPTETKEWNGTWYALNAIIDGESKLLGRRRTKLELLTLAQTLAPEHVDGRNFGSCGHDEHWY